MRMLLRWRTLADEAWSRWFNRDLEEVVRWIIRGGMLEAQRLHELNVE